MCSNVFTLLVQEILKLESVFEEELFKINKLAILYIFMAFFINPVSMVKLVCTPNLVKFS